jgi:hypothetical protein
LIVYLRDLFGADTDQGERLTSEAVALDRLIEAMTLRECKPNFRRWSLTMQLGMIRLGRMGGD